MKRSLSYTVCLAATLGVMTMEASWASFEYGFLGKTPTKTFAASNTGTALVAGSTALSAGWAASFFC